LQKEPTCSDLNSIAVGDLVTKQGHTFEWTRSHRKPSSLDPLRQIGDFRADEIASGLRVLSTANRAALDALYNVSPEGFSSDSSIDQPDQYLTFGCFSIKPSFLKKGYTHLRRVIAAAWLHKLPETGHGLHVTIKHTETSFTFQVLRQENGRSPSGEMLRVFCAKCSDFLDCAAADPDWLDRSKLAVGQEFYRAHTLGCNLGLLHLSLIGGFGAPLINRVLASTGYLVGHQQPPSEQSSTATPAKQGSAPVTNGKVIATRLFETSAMVHTCMLPGALVPGACGWEHSLAVRLLHAAVRERLDPTTGDDSGSAPNRKSSQESGSCPFSGSSSTTSLLSRGKWERAKWGVPINQEDLIVTSMAFSYIVLAAMELMQLWHPTDLLPAALRAAAQPFSSDEEAEYNKFRNTLPASAFQRHSEDTLRAKFTQYTAFLHLWRYISFLMGVQDVGFAVDSILGAKAVTESLVCHLVHPDATSGLLANSIITGMADTSPAYIPRPFLAALTWRLQGPLLAATMRIPWVPGINRDLLVAPPNTTSTALSNAKVDMFDGSIFGWMLWAATESRLLLVRFLTLLSQLPVVGGLVQRGQMATILGFLDYSLDDSKLHDYSMTADPSVHLQAQLLSQHYEPAEGHFGQLSVWQRAHLALYYSGMFLPIFLRKHLGSETTRSACLVLLVGILVWGFWLLFSNY
jgi:hypothetical protein